MPPAGGSAELVRPLCSGSSGSSSVAVGDASAFTAGVSADGRARLVSHAGVNPDPDTAARASEAERTGEDMGTRCRRRRMVAPRAIVAESGIGGEYLVNIRRPH